MKNDFDLIVHKFGREIEQLNIYPLGDVHVGSAQFNEKLFDKWLKAVQDDENGYVVIIGDLIDNGLKESKTNSYRSAMTPIEEERYLSNKLKPIKDRILGAVTGNHENRSLTMVDDCPLYDVLSKLDLEHLYRENMSFLKLSVGEKNKTRQWTYTFALAHGGSDTKTKKFSYSIDGMDVFVTGHTHQPTSFFPAKIVIDPYNDKVRLVGYTHVIVPSFQDYGGYALKGMYMPQDNSKFPVVHLSGLEKEVTLEWK